MRRQLIFNIAIILANDCGHLNAGSYMPSIHSHVLRAQDFLDVMLSLSWR